MRILRPSPRFYGAMLALVASVPLVAAELFLMRRVGVPDPSRMASWCSLALFTSLFLGILLWRFQGAAMTALIFVSAAWFVQAMLSSWRHSNVPLAWFAFLVVAVLGAGAILLQLEFQSPGYDSGMKWYEGRPRAIPGVRCELEDGRALRVSRLGIEGIFVFSEDSQPFFDETENELAIGEPALQLSFRDKVLSCKVLAVSALRSGAGVGFIFKEMGADARKELGDFVEILRGEGYV